MKISKIKKEIINGVLIIIIILFSILFFNEYKKPNTITTDLKLKTNPSEANSENDLAENTSNKNIITKNQCLKNIENSKLTFTEILNKYNLNTISTMKQEDSFTIHETSILLESLGISNGYKINHINPEINTTLKTYISLINSVNDSMWNQTLNINLFADDTFFEFNEINYPEIFELINTFTPNIKSEIIYDISNVISNNSTDILNDAYSITKSTNNDNSVFIQISVYIKNINIKN